MSQLNALDSPEESPARNYATKPILIDMSSPSVSERILKLKDTGAILGYAVLIDPKVFGLSTSAYVRLHAMPGQVKKLETMLADSPEVVEAD